MRGGSRVTPRDLRNIRLKNEYQELMRLDGTFIEVQPIGSQPYQSYKVTFNIKTIVGLEPLFSEKTVCTLTLPPNYPDAPPRITNDTPPPLNRTWHHGGWCVGQWSKEESLVSALIRCARTLQFDPDISGFNGSSEVIGRNLFQENKLNQDLVINNAAILAALEGLEASLSEDKPKIIIGKKDERPKITIKENQDKPKIMLLQR